MLESRIFSVWDGFVGSAALIVLIVLALRIMARTVKLGEVPRHLGVIVGVVILLIMLPAIIVGLWSTLSFGQHLGIIALGIAIILLLGAVSHPPRGTRHKR